MEALAKPNAAAMEVEVVGQDVEAVSSLERELNEESIMVRTLKRIRIDCELEPVYIFRREFN